MREGFLRVGAIVPEIKLGNPLYNAEKIVEKIRDAYDYGVEVVATPELCTTGVSLGDIFKQDYLMEKVNEAIQKIMDETSDLEITIVLGTPLKIENKLYNVALLIYQGEIIGFVPKKNLSPDELRCFNTGSYIYDRKVNVLGHELMFEKNVFEAPNHEGANFDVELSVKELKYLNPENKTIYLSINMTSNYDVVSRTVKVKKEALKLSKDNGIGYVYIMPGINESVTDFVYSGYSVIIDDGTIIKEGEKFNFEGSLIYGDIKLNEEINDYVIEKEEPIDKKAQKELNKYPFVPNTPEDIKERCKEVLELQSSALARRIKQLGHNRVVLGLSGGSDSTLALIVINEAFKKLNIDNKGIIAITMPGFGTSDRTYNNSINLAKEYDVTLREISIKEACIQHYKDIGLSVDDRSVTYENAQARERTQILMDVANMENAFVVGTGDMSELALGWCTYNGDHMSMYAVNCNIPKTLIKHIIRYEAERRNSKTLFDIIDTPISPELLPTDEKGEIAQKTESNIGPYELHDYFLYHFLKYNSTPNYILEIATKAFEGVYNKEEIHKWLNVFLRRFMTQQFKRSCSADGPKVGTIGLSPRGDLVMPSDLDASIWKIM
ncbi:MAG: NAD(+) synthase [Clostridia bacterium]|nr:NAD(+) synthase [Clostridia bacterium]